MKKLNKKGENRKIESNDLQAINNKKKKITDALKISSI